jgi:hypothetical protein
VGVNLQEHIAGDRSVDHQQEDDKEQQNLLAERGRSAA